MREIVIDTETTGLNPNADRIIELACIELVDRKLTGKTFHSYVHPQGMPISAGAFKAHGIRSEHLESAPTFSTLSLRLVEFIGSAPIVAHNAPFDMGFLQAEFVRARSSRLGNSSVCTLRISRQVWPTKSGRGAHTLTAVCERLKVDDSHRVKHGAKVDADILARVYPRLLAAYDASVAAGQRQEREPDYSRELPHAKVIARDYHAAKAVVTCPMCRGNVRLPMNRTGPVKCPVCSARFFAETV